MTMIFWNAIYMVLIFAIEEALIAGTLAFLDKHTEADHIVLHRKLKGA
jgi:hypothetical protein